jgi:hypothetical protein
MTSIAGRGQLSGTPARRERAPSTPVMSKPYAPMRGELVVRGVVSREAGTYAPWSRSQTHGRRRSMSEGTIHKTSYEPPRLTVLGTVHGLTLAQDKKLGGSDGFTFMGQSIMNASS